MQLLECFFDVRGFNAGAKFMQLLTTSMQLLITATQLLTTAMQLLNCMGSTAMKLLNCAAI